jgi:hypothetical protein
MDASTPIGMAVRNAAARGEFAYDPICNEQVHVPTGARYGITDRDLIYRREELTLEVFDRRQGQFVPTPRLPAGHTPDRTLQFTQADLVPGLFDERLAFVQGVWDSMPKRQGCEVHIDHPGRDAYEQQEMAEKGELYARTRDWVPHPQG